MKNRDWFWGSFFLLSAVFVIAGQLGGFKKIGVLSIAATVLLAAMGIQGALKRNFFGVFIPVSLLYLIYQKPLSLPQISVWLLLLAAILAGIGFSILFQKGPHRMHRHCDEAEWNGPHGIHRNFASTSENTDDNNPSVSVHFSSSSKYLHADDLKSGQFSVSFGSLELFFDQVRLHPDGAEIFLECSFGTIKLYLPRQWQVVDHIRTGLGSVENDVRTAHPEPGAPRITLSGSVEMGTVEIHYIA